MPKKQTTYETADGQEFTDRAAAERHEHLVQCKSAYDAARESLGKALLAQLKTADGHSIDFGTRNRFYAVLFSYNNPILAEVTVYWHHWDWTLDDNDRLRIILEWKWPGTTRNDERQYLHIDIGDLYVDREKARLAVLAAKQAVIDRMAEELDELKKCPSSVRIY